jgi:type I restriction enzyme S subunit
MTHGTAFPPNPELKLHPVGPHSFSEPCFASDRSLGTGSGRLRLLCDHRHVPLPPDTAKAAGLNPHPKLKDSGIEWLGEVPDHWEVLQLRRRWLVLDCKHRTVSFVDDGIPLASIREVHGFAVDLSDAKRTTEEQYEEMIDGDRKPKIGDIIYSRNATVGDAAIVTISARFCMGQDVCLIRSNHEFARFVIYALRSQPLIEQAEALMIGSTFRRINVGQIKGFWMPLPLFEEQIAIANYLDQETARIDQMIEKAKAVRPLSASTLVS